MKKNTHIWDNERKRRSATWLPRVGLEASEHRGSLINRRLFAPPSLDYLKDSIFWQAFLTIRHRRLTLTMLRIYGCSAHVRTLITNPTTNNYINLRAPPIRWFRSYLLRIICERAKKSAAGHPGQLALPMIRRRTTLYGWIQASVYPTEQAATYVHLHRQHHVAVVIVLQAGCPWRGEEVGEAL